MGDVGEWGGGVCEYPRHLWRMQGAGVCVCVSEVGALSEVAAASSGTQRTVAALLMSPAGAIRSKRRRVSATGTDR